MKKLTILSVLVTFIAFMIACGGNDNSSKKEQDNSSEQVDSSKKEMTEANIEKYDPKRGSGEFTDYDPGKFNPKWAESGEEIFNTKCIACHKLSDEMLVGPGWAGITKKHSATWMLNFLTNTDDMLDKDPELQKQLEICMVRMPDQNLTGDDAKHVYAFMRKNDGAK